MLGHDWPEQGPSPGTLPDVFHITSVKHGWERGISRMLPAIQC